MSLVHYRLSAAFTASLSLALAACTTTQSSEQSQPAAPNAQQASTSAPSEIDTEATIWTILGFAKKESERHQGPQTGGTVSPILWQAALDTLDFVKLASEDPLARSLRSDAIAVTVTRQARLGDGNWLETTIARHVETDLENAILNRARQLKREWTATASPK